MTEARQIVLASRPEGVPTPENFRLETVTLPALSDGEMLVRTIWLSLDPYMRGRMNAGKSYAAPVEVGGVMEAGCVGEVIASRNTWFAQGDIVQGQFGWADHAISDGVGVRKIDPDTAPIQTSLGVLGMPGITAWVGLNIIAKAKEGETIVVSAATGAVGGVVGQLAKAKGLTVLGVAGGAEKCAYAVEELGYEACLDHRATDSPGLAAQIAEAAPRGVDIYFENVGGTTLEGVLPNLNDNARIPLCGMIAWYNGKGIDTTPPLPLIWRNILTRRLRVQGFIIFDHFHRFGDFLAEVGPMVADGRLRYRETVTEGLENAQEAFLAMLEGGNFGKTLVKVAR